jgi:hypothetical protein
MVDEELGLGPHAAWTARARKKVAWEVAQTSFDQARRNLEHQAELQVSAAECARVAQEEGGLLAGLQRRRERAWAAPGDPQSPAAGPEYPSERLVLQADATAVLTVAGEEHKMVWCATGFALEDRQSKQGSERPLIVRRRYAAHGGDFDDFGERMKALANRLGARRAQKVAFVADGAPCLWRWAAENLPHGSELIQDYWHVCEHLHGVARELYGEEEGRRRGEAWARTLRDSRVQEVLDALRHEHRRRRGRLRERVEEEIRYLEAGRGRMDYARLEREGWPIGSGAIEGTCKHLVKQRFNLTGARWRRRNIEPVLALRLSMFNEEWEQDWRADQLRAA